MKHIITTAVSEKLDSCSALLQPWLLKKCCITTIIAFWDLEYANHITMFKQLQCYKIIVVLHFSTLEWLNSHANHILGLFNLMARLD